MLPHKVFPGSISVLYSKCNPFLRWGKGKIVFILCKKAIFFYFTQTARWNRMGPFLTFFLGSVSHLPQCLHGAGLRDRDTEVGFTLWPDPAVSSCQSSDQSEKPSSVRGEPPPQQHKGIPSKPLCFFRTHTSLPSSSLGRKSAFYTVS